MEQYIHVTKGTIKQLCEQLKVSHMTVWRALNFDNDYPMSLRIRKHVLDEKLGILMSRIPTIQTFHDHDNYMRQYLPNKAMIEVNKTTGVVEVIFDGKVVRHQEDVYMRELEGIQVWANSLK